MPAVHRAGAAVPMRCLNIARAMERCRISAAIAVSRNEEAASAQAASAAAVTQALADSTFSLHLDFDGPGMCVHADM